MVLSITLTEHIRKYPLKLTSFPNSTQVDAKGAIYLTTQNRTFPITLTSLKSRDETTQDTPQIVFANVQNDSNHDYWEDRTDELLLSNDINATYDDIGNNNVWKRDFKRSINDAVSRNITLVLENLLKNYENSQLPTHGKGKVYFISFYIKVYNRI